MTTDLVFNKLRLGRTPRKVLAAVLAALAILSAVVATINWGVASARDDTVVGESVTKKQMTAIVAAARSCPVLTPARIAGQLMTESGLDPRARDTASGGRGIAGLNDEDWKRWKPWPDASRSDVSASVLALAHQMCDFTGQLRLAGTPGDQWRLAVAAFHTGLPAVTRAKGVPAEAVEYVDLVSGYAGYYGKLKQFGGPGLPTATPPPASDAKGVPAPYVRLVVSAGSVCDQVTPAMVAAQLMTLSGFDANKLGSEGQRGIAQFLPEVWQTYGPDGGSAWDPTAAIPAVGNAMCGLADELASLDGDPYLLALAAYRNGPTAVRQTGGSFDQGTETFLRAVKALTDLYALDTRLTKPTPTKPAPSAPPTSQAPDPDPSSSDEAPSPSPKTPSTPPSDTSEPDTKPTTAAPKPTTAAPKPAPKPQRPAGAKQIFHPRTGLCVSSGSTGDGTRLELRTCTEAPAQWWDVRNDGTIRSRGLCMDIAWGGSEDGTAIQVAICSGNPAQSWKINDKGGIISQLNGKSVDVDMNAKGKPLELWIYVANAEQTWRLR
ncbi:hypothetical protein E0H26_14305 [Micromonospora zingiberis]|uniref:Ricin B lectin domain-containing protein n=1 Tax=Micromonospora zingiberis TaxID=2053011 RepID=A0A4R0GJ38_9ACTN|nr:ricin-type beta-trefoil lectin domain protein [Micromonospora zingiberis]TCB96787.1 hypothetical protein E0H26_14305 [Micromonospora zingiberis]